MQSPVKILLLRRLHGDVGGGSELATDVKRDDGGMKIRGAVTRTVSGVLARTAPGC
jgi:hypothetical protein